MKTKLGLRIVYRPRVPNGRQSELFGFITRICDAEKNTVDIIVFPSHSEPVHHNNVAMASDTIKVHCWATNESSEGGDVSALMDMIAGLEERIAALEARRGPGRPRVEAA